MERILNLGLAAALVIVLVLKIAPGAHHASVGPSASSGAARQKYVMIAAATWGPYWIDSKAGLLDKARELGVDATFTGPATVDVNAQMDYINRAVAQKVDGIVMVPMSDALTPAINAAMANGVPVVCADADAPSSKRYSFVGTGNYNAGLQGGELLARAVGGRGEVALMTIPGADNLTQRVKGYRAALSRSPQIRVVVTGNDQGSSTEAQKVCRAILQAHPRLAGFGCVDAIGGQGAAVAVKEAGKAGQVKIIAMDRDKATLRFIQDGVIDAAIAQRTYTMAYLALQMLYDLRNDRVKVVNDWRKVGVNPLPPLVDTGSFPITRANVKAFVRE